MGDWEDADRCATAAVDRRGIGEGDSEMVRRCGLQLLRAKAWGELPDDAERIFDVYAHHQRSSPFVREFYAPCIWALAAAIGGRVRVAEMWSTTAMATAQTLPVPSTPYLELLFARAVIHRELGDNDAARKVIDELRSVNMPTYHSLRMMAEVELAMGFISEDRLAEAAGVLERAAPGHSDIVLGPRIYDAVDRAWTDVHLAAGDISRAHHNAQGMRVGFWRDATLAKVLVADGATQQAANLLDSLSPMSPRQQVTLGCSTRSLADDDPARSQAEMEAALTTASAEGMYQTVVGRAGHALYRVGELGRTR